MYQLGDKSLKVAMKLFALNRYNLIKKLKENSNLPKSSVILLQGGESKYRYCSDHEEIFRQVNKKHLDVSLLFQFFQNLTRNPIFIGVLVLFGK